MDNELTRDERWCLLKEIYRGTGKLIPWDRMVLPQQEWFDDYEKFYGIEIPKYRSKLTKEEIEHLELVKSYE